MKQIILPSNTILLSEAKDLEQKCVLWQSTAAYTPKTEIAKLQSFPGSDKDTYGFAHLANSACGVCGFSYASPQEAIEAALGYGNVYIFESVREALTWMAKQL